MGSRWFRGGVGKLETDAASWTAAAALRACPVSGTSIVSSNVGWTLLSEFLAAGNSLVGAQASLPASPNRGVTWSTDRLNFWFNNELNFGVVAQGTNLAGVVYYDGSSATPSTATLWACQENNGGPIVSNGGELKWGASGQNIALTLRCLNSSNRYTFQGTLSAIYDLDTYWTDSSLAYKIGYALVRSTSTVTPQFSWKFMSDLPVGSTLFWCTGASPGAAGMPTTAYGDRLYGYTQETTNTDYMIKSTSLGRVPVTWSNTVLTAGETISAVVAFAFQGTYAAGSARIIHWDDVTDHLIGVAEDITYMQTSTFTMNQIQVA